MPFGPLANFWLIAVQHQIHMFHLPTAFRCVRQKEMHVGH
jgi:hypothetical protein